MYLQLGIPSRCICFTLSRRPRLDPIPPEQISFPLGWSVRRIYPSGFYAFYALISSRATGWRVLSPTQWPAHEELPSPLLIYIRQRGRTRKARRAEKKLAEGREEAEREKKDIAPVRTFLPLVRSRICGKRVEGRPTDGEERGAAAEERGKKFCRSSVSLCRAAPLAGLRGKGIRMRRVWEICYFLPSLPPPPLDSPNTLLLLDLYEGCHPWCHRGWTNEGRKLFRFRNSLRSLPPLLLPPRNVNVTPPFCTLDHPHIPTLPPLFNQVLFRAFAFYTRARARPCQLRFRHRVVFAFRLR